MPNSLAMSIPPLADISNCSSFTPANAACNSKPMEQQPAAALIRYSTGFGAAFSPPMLFGSSVVKAGKRRTEISFFVPDTQRELARNAALPFAWSFSTAAMVVRKRSISNPLIMFCPFIMMNFRWFFATLRRPISTRRCASNYPPCRD